jgi:hypothetical protein
VTARCTSPLELPALADYWFGDGGEAEHETIEEHLLGCGGCADRLRELVALGHGVRRLAHAGVFNVALSRGFVDAAVRGGLRVREYRVPPGGRVDCTVTLDDDLLVGTLTGDFRGLERVDLILELKDVPPGPFESLIPGRVEDLPFDPAAGALLLGQSVPLARRMPAHTVVMRLVAPGPAGDRVLGDYTFAHTPSPGLGPDRA